MAYNVENWLTIERTENGKLTSDPTREFLTKFGVSFANWVAKF